MESKLKWLLVRLTHTLWFRATFLGIVAILTALIAAVLDDYISIDISARIDIDAVESILTILASSMLAVTTFSLNVMVSAYNSATNNVTPRATRILMRDATTQNVLAIFIGSFLFSLVSIIVLKLQLYGMQGRVILFGVTLFVVLLIVITLIRWIHHLSKFGRMDDTINRVEKVVNHALIERIKAPYLGGECFEQDSVDLNELIPVCFNKMGYIEHIDMTKLAKYANDQACSIYVMCLPGALVHYKKPLIYINKNVDSDAQKAMCDAFTVSMTRSFDQDPRFGLSVLSEIASRALSAAINDSGTAIDIITRAGKTIATWQIERCDEKDVIYPQVYVPPLKLRDLMHDIFSPIERDSGNCFEVQLRLQKTYLMLMELDPALYGDVVLEHARSTLIRAEKALALQDEKKALRRVFKQIQQHYLKQQ